MSKSAVMPPGDRKKRASGATIPEAVRVERGTGQVVSLRLSPAALARLDAAAERAGLSRSGYVERLAGELPPAIVTV